MTIDTGMFTLAAAFVGCEGWHERVFSASNTEDGVQLQPQGWAIVFRASAEAGATVSIRWNIAA